MEIWKPILIDNQDTNYHVSSWGRVRSVMPGRAILILKSHAHGLHKYIQVGIRINKKSRTFRVHRLVAQAFIPNPENKPTVNHKNGIKTDNRVVNLEWATHQENIRHAIDVLGISYDSGHTIIGEKNGNNKLTPNEVLKIRANPSNKSRTILSKQFGVSCTTINCIIKRKTWRHI